MMECVSCPLTPKSDSFTSPVPFTSRLEGLTSRCTIRLSLCM